MGCNVKPRYRIFCHIFTAFLPNFTALKMKISNFLLPNYSRIFLKLWICRIFWLEFTEFNSLDFHCTLDRIRTKATDDRHINPSLVYNLYLGTNLQVNFLESLDDTLLCIHDSHARIRLFLWGGLKDHPFLFYLKWTFDTEVFESDVFLSYILHIKRQDIYLFICYHLLEARRVHWFTINGKQFEIFHLCKWDSCKTVDFVLINKKNYKIHR